MFKNFFKSKTGESVETPIPNLATLLILTMTAELQQAEQTTGVLVPVIDNIRASYDRLLKLGMGSTQNAIAIKQRIDEHDEQQSNITKAQELIRFVKAAQQHFGPRSILVSYTAFNDLCKRYNLATGLLTDYFGVIPERNIQDMELVMSRIPTFGYRDELNHYKGRSGWLLKVDSIDVQSGEEAVVTYVKDNGSIIPVNKYLSNYDGAWWPENLYELKKNVHYKYSCLTKIHGTILKPNTMLIACPKKYLKNPDIKVSKLPVDPAIFQYTPYGVLIHTIWGEEAEDEALKQFMELNTEINKSSF